MRPTINTVVASRARQSLCILFFLIFTFASQAQTSSSTKDSVTSGTDPIYTVKMSWYNDYIYITLEDAGGSEADSLRFWVKDTTGLGWSRVAGMNLLTNTKDTVMVPGSGSTQTYMLWHWAVDSLKIESQNVASGEKTYINIVAKKE